MNNYSIVNVIHQTTNRAGFPRDLQVVAVINQTGHIFGYWDGPDAQRKAAEYMPQLPPIMEAPAMGGRVVQGRMIT